MIIKREVEKANKPGPIAFSLDCKKLSEVQAHESTKLKLRALAPRSES